MNLLCSMDKRVVKVTVRVSIQMPCALQCFHMKSGTKLLIIWKNSVIYNAMQLLRLRKFHPYLVLLREKKLLKSEMCFHFKARCVSVHWMVIMWKAPLTLENTISLITMDFDWGLRANFVLIYCYWAVCWVYSNLCNLLLGNTGGDMDLSANYSVL